MVKAAVNCFCTSSVSPQDPPGTVASDWCALLCGHVYHVSCMKEWMKTSNPGPGIMQCPLRCPPQHVSVKNDQSKRRSPHAGFIKLYFEKDVYSDPMQSSQWSDPVARLERPARAARSTFVTAGDSEEEVSENEDGGELPATARRDVTEIQRLRRELREAQLAARQARTWRKQAEDAQADLHEAETRARELQNRVWDLEDDDSDLDPEMNEIIEPFRTALDRVRGELAHARETAQQLQELLEGVDMEKSMLENSLHETQLKHDEAIRRLEAKIRDAGQDGERKREQLQAELNGIKDDLMRARAANDKIELSARKAVVKARDQAKEEIDRAQEQLAVALAARKGAEDEMQKSRDELARIRSANASWTMKYGKLRSKYDKLKARKQAVSDDDSESEEDEDRPRIKKTRLVKSPGARKIGTMTNLDLSPERMPFRVRNAATVAPVAAKKSLYDIDLVSDDEDVVPVVKTLARRTLQCTDSASSSRVMVEDEDILPTLSASTSVAGERHNRAKDKLSKQRSDRHMPNFASGLSETGPRGKLKVYSKR
ncbi:hypothetical protein OIV83_002991 [Microbotryomycetes sp. JL201]|nr:hypothetical protein OIV83_002991 [Microbotryomycetes sp. JL201]